MKKNMYKACSLLLGLALLLSAIPFAVSAAKDNTLYSWSATTVEKDRKVFSSNLVTSAKGEVRWNESGTMYTAQGKQTVTAHCFVNEVAGFGNQLYGLPTVTEGGKKRIEPLRLDTYPAVSTEGVGALNVSFLYAYKPQENGVNAAMGDALRLYVSENGMDWSEDHVTVRSAEIVGSGATAKGVPVIYYRVQTENLLDIEGIDRGDLIQGVRIVPEGETGLSKGSFSLCELNVTGYESRSAFETAVPVASAAQVSAVVNEDSCRKTLVDAAVNSDADSELGVILDAISLVTQVTLESVADMLTTTGIRLVDGIATEANARIERMFEWMYERELLAPEKGEQLIKDYEAVATTRDITQDLNTPQQMFSSYANSKPGDILLQITETAAHAYMIIESNPVYLVDEVSINPNESTMTYLTLDGKKTETYFNVYAKGTFVPVTVAALANGTIRPPRVDVHVSFADGARVVVASNLNIKHCEIAVDGQTVTVNDPNVAGLVCADQKLTDTVAALSNGKHEMTVTVTGGLGEPAAHVIEFEVKDGKAIVLGIVAPNHDAVCQSKAMTDVDKNAWYHEAVDYALANGIMGGYNATTFGPNDTLSRAMVVQVLYNKEGQPAISGKHDFTDVPADQWFNNAVTWGTQKGVMGGYGDGKFGPNDSVTVEQIAVILWNYSGNPAFTGNADSVGTHSGWAANALSWAVENDILEGVPYENVTGAATRAQTAQMLMNYLTKN